MFKHQPLATDRHQIRLIRCRLYSKMLEIKISNYDLNHDLPKFNTLSYMWRPEQPSYSIQLNGQRFIIRDNLYTFFQTLFPAQFGAEAFFWIDQICIDQMSIPERNAQVAMMAEIYGRADHVVVWLNPDQSESEPLVLDEVVDCMQSMSKPNEIPVRLLSRNDAETVATAILTNRYWTRVWIVQEVLLACNIIIFFGHHHLSWESLTALCDLYTVHGTAATSASALRSMVYNYQDSRPTLSNLLWDFRNNECENPRDKVFGYLGILSMWQISVSADTIPPKNPGRPSAIIVDYAKSVHAVLLDAVPIITAENLNEHHAQAPRQRISAIIHATEQAFFLCRAMIPSLFAVDDFVPSIRVTYVSNLERLLQRHHPVSLTSLEGREGQWIVKQIEEAIEDPLSFGKRVRLLERNEPEAHKEIIKAEFARLRLLLA